MVKTVPVDGLVKRLEVGKRITKESVINDSKLPVLIFCVES